VLTTGPDAVTITGLAADQIVMLLGRNDVPFSEVSAHRASLEEAYLALTRDAVEFQGNPNDRTSR
jgi:ABC-2 type transport system ATP-binding protein